MVRVISSIRSIGPSDFWGESKTIVLNRFPERRSTKGFVTYRGRKWGPRTSGSPTLSSVCLLVPAGNSRPIAAHRALISSNNSSRHGRHRRPVVPCHELLGGSNGSVAANGADENVAMTTKKRSSAVDTLRSIECSMSRDEAVSAGRDQKADVTKGR
ncbi:unnamed protein product [Arctogadus glacialis]